MTSILLSILIILSYATVCFLGGKIIYEILTRKSNRIYSTIKITLNIYTIIFFCYFYLAVFSLTVRVPFKLASTQEKSIMLLKQWLFKEELNMIIMGLVIILLNLAVSYFLQIKLEKVKKLKPIVILCLINIFMLTITALLTHHKTLQQLTIEIGYNFK